MNQVLLIDDDVELVGMFSEYLEREGFRSTCVHNGFDGVREALRGDDAIAVLDVMMPRANGSHELRSPLARLQAAVGLAHQQPEKIGSSLLRIERESMRMDKLVGELLTLSRLDASPGLGRREQLDLAKLADEIAADARFEASPEASPEAGPEAGAEAGTDAPRISVEAPGAILVQGDPDLPWSALENVVRNAVRHGGSGGAVPIVLHADAGWAHVGVHGLGLAIAQRVLAAHGGSIGASHRDGGGLQARLSLPRHIQGLAAVPVAALLDAVFAQRQRWAEL